MRLLRRLFDPLRQARWWAPAGVFVLGAVLAALTAAELHRAARERQDLRLDIAADGLGAALQRHLADCQQALRMAALLAGAEPPLDARRWQALAQAVASQRQPEADDACGRTMVYVSAAAESGVLWSPRSAEPADPFDPWQDPAQRAALRAAGDAGQPRLSAPTRWPGADAGAAVLAWYAPVTAAAPSVIGYVGLPVQIAAVRERLAQQQPGMQLTLETHAAAGPAATGTPGAAGERTLQIGGRTWTLRAVPAVQPAPWHAPLRADSVSLTVGLFFSAVLAWLSRRALTQSARAHALARRYGHDARGRELRLRSLLDGTRDGIFTLDTHGHVVSANRGALDILGYTASELSSQPSSMLFPADRAQAYLARWIGFVRQARAVEDGRGPVQEMELQHRDGRRLYVRSSLSLVRNDADEFVVWMIGDVTHEREMEQQAQKAAALQRAIMDAAPIGMLTVAPDWRIATANHASHLMLGYAPGELAGRDVRTLVDPAELGERGGRGVAGARAGPEVFHGPRGPNGQWLEIEWRHVRKDGSRFPAGLIALPLADAAGQPLASLHMFTDITERKRAAARIEHLALHDSLTGLANRRLLQDRAAQALARARRGGNGFALVLIDLDGFKEINDTLGHAIGDEVLKVVAQRLLAAVRASDTVVRMGGDEFALLLPDVDGAEAALAIGRKVRAALSEDLVVDGGRLRPTASIGIALHPAHGDDLSSLLKTADAAMYHAKAGGRDAVSLYDLQMADHSADRLALLADLHLAAARDELVLHYQPLVDADSGRVHALEALLRWQHPQRGMIPPGEFIPLAEETGLIVDIGAWVVRTACRDLAQLRRTGRPDLRIAVNLSPRQFTADDLEATVVDALHAAGLDGAALELEITESVLMNSLERTQRVLSALRAIGVRIAIDDFGTGYSSLSYLAHFPVQTVKVDRSFVRQIDSGEGTALLAGAIVAMAHSLGLEVVAEGVETIGQHSHLAELGCELLQGFRFSKAVPLHELAATFERVESMEVVERHERMEIWGRATAPMRL